MADYNEQLERVLRSFVQSFSSTADAFEKNFKLHTAILRKLDRQSKQNAELLELVGTLHVVMSRHMKQGAPESAERFERRHRTAVYDAMLTLGHTTDEARALLLEVARSTAPTDNAARMATKRAIEGSRHPKAKKPKRKQPRSSSGTKRTVSP